MDVRTATLRSTGKLGSVTEIPPVDENVDQWYAVSVDTPPSSWAVIKHDPSGAE